MAADSVTPTVVDPGAAPWNDRFLGRWADDSEHALVWEGGAWSGRELVARSLGAADHLRSLVDRGTPLPALVDESPVAIAYAAGGALAARPLAPVGTRLPVADLAAAVAGLGAPVLLTAPEHERLARDVAAATGVEVRRVEERNGGGGADVVDARDPVAVLHTSGTTGAPKAVVAMQGAIGARVDLYQHVMPLGPGDRFCSFSAFHHTTGINMAMHALAVGAAVVPMAWFSDEGWRAAGRLGMTHALVVPTMLDRLLHAGALGEATPRVLQYGAAPISPDLLIDAMAALPGADFLQIFGQTEVSPITSLTPDDHRRAVAADAHLLTTVGRAVAGAELRLARPAADGVGELCVRAPHTFVTDADGWRATGDLATIDDDGYVTLRGRLADRIVWSGENVYPAEVEAVIAAHPGVREVAVVGVPDRRHGEMIRAVVVALDPNSVPSEEDLVAHASARLARFKVPSDWVVVDELPRNAAGKVVRRRLV